MFYQCLFLLITKLKKKIYINHLLYSFRKYKKSVVTGTNDFFYKNNLDKALFSRSTTMTALIYQTSNFQ